jgi:hypothetical protein
MRHAKGGSPHVGSVGDGFRGYDSCGRRLLWVVRVDMAYVMYVDSLCKCLLSDCDQVVFIFFVLCFSQIQHPLRHF